MDKNIVKIISKNLSNKYSQKLFDHAKQYTKDTLKTAPKRVILKTPEATGDFIGNIIADKITSVSKTLLLNDSEANEEEIIRERFIPLELRHRIIDNLRLKTKNYWWSKINII